MKVKELIAQLQLHDPEAVVVVAGFETQSTGLVAEADTIKECVTVSVKADSMTGDRSLAKEGSPSVWLGWGDDYRTEFFVSAITDPDELAWFYQIPKSLSFGGFFIVSSTMAGVGISSGAKAT